jgi:serine/threonine-protein kinase
MDQYELRGLLGQGGMGAVYSAYDTTLSRPVALKLLNASVQGAEALARFEREARLASQLSHVRSSARLPPPPASM